MELVSSTSSSSPSSSPVASSSIANCQVCLQEGHGFHFGAYTCRACAAFFRRCHFSPKSEARCNKLNGKCKPKAGRWFCKKCRLDRCQELRMTTDNIQYHRDAFNSSVSFAKNRTLVNRLKDRVNVPMTVEKALGLPHVGVFLRNDADGPMTIPFIEVSHIVKKAMQDLLKTEIVERRGRKLSNLEQLAVGLESYQALQNEHLSELSVLSKYEQMNDLERSMCAAAKWMTCSDRIRAMDENVKIVFLQFVWQIWGRLERMAMTAKMRVNRRCGKRQFVISHDKLIDYDGMKADMSWGSKHSFEDLSYFLIPTEIFYDEIIGEIIELQPDSVELAFLLVAICVQIAENRELTHKRTSGLENELDGLHDVVSNDLHNYYIKQNKSMYAVRLKQLMKIKERFMILWKKRTEKYQIGTILEFFRMQFSLPEYFDTPC